MEPHGLRSDLRESRDLTLELVADLDAEGWLGPCLPIVNPPLWEVGHVAWFTERWVLREACGRAALFPDLDETWNSAVLAHDDRWRTALPDAATTTEYLARVHALVDEVLAAGCDDALRYFAQLALFHEDMHNEAFAYTRQTLGHAATPTLRARRLAARRSADGAAGDEPFAGGPCAIGSPRDADFVFDNEKWRHEVELAPFAIARRPVTDGDFAAFVDDRGYRDERLWSAGGWAWRTRCEVEQPAYWRRADGGWERRVFDRWVPLDAGAPVLHVSAFEAEAFCAWAGRRLPSEFELEHAARSGRVAGLDTAGWCWTASAFEPYPGFAPDPYREYSEPWFGSHRVLRGGAWVTERRLCRPAYRNFYTPDRRDVWAGVRTCAR